MRSATNVKKYLYAYLKSGAIKAESALGPTEVGRYNNANNASLREAQPFDREP
jgi:hypothetical protein